MPNNPVIWFEIYVQDMPRAKAFYEAVLGRELQPLAAPDSGAVGGMEMCAFPMEMNAPGAAGALAKMDGIPSGAGGTMVYFHCEDCAVEAARVADAGGTLQREKMSIGQYGYIAIAADPDGNSFGLHSMK